jgi:hypothetical protein
MPSHKFSEPMICCYRDRVRIPARCAVIVNGNFDILKVAARLTRDRQVDSRDSSVSFSAGRPATVFAVAVGQVVSIGLSWCIHSCVV